MRKWIIIGASLVAAQALALYLLGQPAICECGSIKMWEGVVLGPGNSQHLSDWYTPSHIIHGLLFYAALWLAFPKIPVSARLMIAIGAEAAWEIIENTPVVIDHYRQQALAQGYVGDSIINSVSDTIAMIGGFLLAWRLPILATVALGITLELFVGFMIHDNLILNVLGFFWTPDFIASWQAGA